MQQEIRFATFNVYNLAPPAARLYDNLGPLTADEYAAKVAWTAAQLDQLDADVIGLQEIFSLATLRDVLAHSRRYRDAVIAGIDADPAAERLTPQVALVSRLPLAQPARHYRDFPDGVALPAGSHDAERFARAPLHALVLLPDGRADDVSDPTLYAQAHLRSLIRRGTEAVALRALLTGMKRGGRRPCVVMGDFNDTADAVTTTIVLGAGATGQPGDELGARLFDANQIQLRQDHLRHVGYTNIHEGHYMTIDHVLVSEEFNPASRYAIGEVLDVSYLNDHLLQARPESSDHGQVLVRLRLYGARDGASLS